MHMIVANGTDVAACFAAAAADGSWLFSIVYETELAAAVLLRGAGVVLLNADGVAEDGGLGGPWCCCCCQQGDDDDDEEEEEEEVEQHYCVVCEKRFRSAAQLANHEKSKKHLEAVTALREVLEEEEAWLLVGVVE
jgi:hypothetical protein